MAPSKRSKPEKRQSTVWKTTVDGLTAFIVDHPIVEKYSNRINDKIRAEYGVIEEIVSHGPSVGTFYERLLAHNLIDYLPSSWRVGTGFVFDDRSTQTSPQIDVLVYEDTAIAPVFRVGDLVVVLPAQVRGLVEVKKSLRLSDIDDLVNKYFFTNTGTEFPDVGGIQVLNVFSYKSSFPIKKCYERAMQALERNLAGLSNKDFSGTQKAVPNITVPRFYFLDSPYFVDTRVTQQGLTHSIEVSILGVPNSNGGASDLFSRFVWRTDMRELDRVRFSTIGLYKPVASAVLQTTLILRKYVSVQEICSGLDDMELQRLNRRKLRQLTGFMVPYGFRIQKADELQLALKNGHIAPIWDNSPLDGTPFDNAGQAETHDT